MPGPVGGARAAGPPGPGLPEPAGAPQPKTSHCKKKKKATRHLTFFNLKMCLLPLPFVETFFSAAGADLYFVFLSRADRRWISCLL